MTVQEFYATVNGNYDEVMGRLLKEERVVKYLRIFVESDEMQQLQDTLAAEDWPEAFRHSHSIKGMCLNLALTQLATSSSILCETLRPGIPTEDPKPLLAKTLEDYEIVKEAVSQL